MEGTPATRHVPALDGVRGVAVLLVLLFHLGVPGFRAGFLGVDVFFVLSGFLITSLLIAEADSSGRIHLSTFWSRRIRRLMPAVVVLLLVVAAVTAVGATFTERESMRGDLLATTAYLANWHFIQTSAYFVDTGLTSPLQHTWSLAIEEQFYLVWPLALGLLVPVVRRPRLLVAVLGVAAAVASAVLLFARWSPEAVERAYMGTDTRIFEPLIGAVGAAVVATSGGRRLLERAGTPLVFLGAAGVAASVALIRSDTPSYFAGGAVALSMASLLLVAPLWVDRGGVLRRALGWKPLVWLGAVSYGVYLWHWPFVVWLDLREATGTSAIVRGAAVVALTLGVSALSFYLIEQPIRRGRRPLAPERAHARRLDVLRPRWVLAAVPVVMLLVAGTSLAATMVPPPAPRQPVIMLVGDSVPLHLRAALDEEAAERGWRIVSAARGACSVTGEVVVTRAGKVMHPNSGCPETLVSAQDEMIRAYDPDVVLWWDRWSVSDFLTAEGEHVMSGTPRFWSLRKATLAAAVDRLTRRGAQVVFMAVEPPGYQAVVTERPSWWIHYQVDHYADVTTRWNRLLSRFARANPDLATFVSITADVCRVDVAPCDDRIDGVSARPDGTHYEGPGEDLARERVADLIAAVLAADP